MSYLHRLDGANLTHTFTPGPTPAPPAGLAAALDTVPGWGTAWQGRKDIVDRLRTLPGADIDAQVVDLTREHAAELVAAVLDRRPLPAPIGDRITALRREAEATEAEREALRLAAADLLVKLADILRASTDTVMAHLDTRLGEIIAQARKLNISPADLPAGAAALRVGDEQRAALLRLEDLAEDLAEVRSAQLAALEGRKQLDASHCFADVHELLPWGEDAPWPGDLTRPDAAHLAWIATTPGVRAWVPTTVQAQETADRLKAAHERAEYDYLRRQRSERGALGIMQTQRLDQLERIVKNTPAEDMSPSQNHRPRPEVAAAQARRGRAARAEAYRHPARS
ncbi:hypothetical protein [Nocardiopsis tropica]|uniref:DUF222 domain-containing protein n=1 Tax=Nocardiopsis tropica TaxID=109330 RepID=A0ABU7KLA1_9ACTN|nr:hypothetical protein [Nocardiopsis umidischolae]MEE2050064.1 hypothetical protein [Nocardiopsis umidischolae]